MTPAYELRTRKNTPIMAFDSLDRAQAEQSRRQRMGVSLALWEVVRQERRVG